MVARHRPFSGVVAWLGLDTDESFPRRLTALTFASPATVLLLSAHTVDVVGELNEITFALEGEVVAITARGRLLATPAVQMLPPVVPCGIDVTDLTCQDLTEEAAVMAGRLAGLTLYANGDPHPAWRGAAVALGPIANDGLLHGPL